jgi:membrane-bound lytic murein transglycosylase F
MTMQLRQIRHLLIPAALLAVVALVTAMKPAPSALEQIRERGELVVVTRTAPTTYYHDQHGATGLEYELASDFARELGVELRVITRDSISGLLAAVDGHHADLAAAGLTVTPERQAEVRFSAPYQHITEKLVYRLGGERPRQLADLAGKHIAVLADSSHAERLQALQNEYDFRLEEVEGASAERLMTLVDEGYFDYTVVDSNAYAVNRTLFPELAAAFDLGEPQPLAWALRQGKDNSLYLAVQRFITQKKADGTVAGLKERFYGHMKQFNLFAARSFLKHMEQRLPRYAEAFRKAGERYNLDWRLLAAMGYQESLWDESAVSPTGVRGLMMLTRATASEMGVADRTDALESIDAGAAYLRKLLDRVPEDISEPDRTWMAVAAYNVGWGHVEDARKITEYQGDDPHNWADVRKRLPLLKQPDYYRYTRHGYARGGAQSVLYVSHIKRYYNQLVWASDSERHGPTLLAMSQ